MNHKELQQKFHRVRKLYFPDWEEGSNWQIRAYGGKGYCDVGSKTIKVGEPTENYRLIVLIIHEIAHAVSTDDHGDRWLKKMDEVAVRAAEVGDRRLENELREHIAWVTGPNAYDVTEQEVYAAITDAASDQPTATFENIVGWVAQGYGQDLQTFLKAYPRAREAYDGADRPNLRFAANRIDAK